MAAIAATAGVSLKTVYLVFETKGNLLRALWHLLLRGDRDTVPVGEQDWYREVLDEPDPARALRLNLRNSRAVKVRAGRLLEVIRGAAPGDRDIATLWNASRSSTTPTSARWSKRSRTGAGSIRGTTSKRPPTSCGR